MAQHDYVIANGSGAAVRSDLNNGLAAIASQNSGATAPSTTYAYMTWADTTAGVMKMRNGANNAWITLYQLDAEWSTIAFENGTAAAPSIYFKDSGTDTGIYSPGVDQVGVSTGGIGRITVDASGNVNIDSNTFYVDAVNNRVSIGSSSASSLLTLFNTTASDASEPSLTFGNNSFATQNPGCVKTANAGLALEVQSPSTGTFQNRGRFRIDGGSSTFATLAFSSDNGSSYTERLRVTSPGNVGIGTSPTYQLELSTDSAGKPSTNTWTIVSDERIKEDIELADLSLCYQAVKGIPLKYFKWKDTVYTEEQVHDRHKLGWISQDVKAVFPKAVRISEFKYNQVFSETVIPAVDEELDEDGNVVIPSEPERIEKELVSEDIIEDCHDLNVDQLYAAMYGAIQMLMIKVEALEATVAALELGA